MAEIGHWGRKHREHLKRHRPKMYARLRNSGKLNAYLAEVDKAAEERMEKFVQQYLKKNPPPENATEHEKAAHRGVMRHGLMTVGFEAGWGGIWRDSAG